MSAELESLKIDPTRLRRLVELAREEDIGRWGDITTKLAAVSRHHTARVVCREDAVLCGLPLAAHILEAFPIPPAFEASGTVRDGDRAAKGTVLGNLAGPAEAVLTCERTLLNFLQRLCGVATLTARFVAAVAGTPAKIYDTRKTIPGWRDLDKYAVRCGGGQNHRRGLHDAVLIKDNHLAGVPTERLAGHLFEMLNEAALLDRKPDFVEVEVDTLEQLEEVFKVVGVHVVLLDNFTLDDLRAGVRRRDELELQGKVALEASGAITLQTVRAVAQTGVDRIAVGALTHSAPAVDIGVDY